MDYAILRLDIAVCNLGVEMIAVGKAIDDKNLEKSYQLIQDNPQIAKEEFLAKMGIEEEMKMSGLSLAQSILIECLKFLTLNAETITGIMLMICEDEQISKMAEFLEKTPNPTEKQIVEEAQRISEENK